MMNKWDQYFLNVAKLTAELSYAQRLKVGAVAVRDKRIILCGYNGTPQGWDNCCEDEHNKTLDYVLHAEENLILYAAKTGISLQNTHLYITHAPCIHCARMIYGSNIQRVVYLDAYRCTDGLDFLKNMKVDVVHQEEKYG